MCECVHQMFIVVVSNELACQTDEVVCVRQSQCLRHEERSQHCALWLKFTHSITVRTEGEGPVEYSPQTGPIWEQAIKIVSRLGAIYKKLTCHLWEGKCSLEETSPPVALNCVWPCAEQCIIKFNNLSFFHEGSRLEGGIPFGVLLIAKHQTGGGWKSRGLF